MNKITVFVVDDHKLIREMWRLVFSQFDYIRIIGESGEFEEAISMIRDMRPDIVLLDINLSHASGMDAVPLIRKYSPGTRIIAVSMHNQPAYAKKMFRLGAKGYVTKNSSPQEIVRAIEYAIDGRTYVCEEIKELIAGRLCEDDKEEPDVQALSLREIEIIRLIKEGYSSKEIAAQLSLSVKTIEAHRYNILKKLRLKNTAALINFISQSDLTA